MFDFISSCLRGQALLEDIDAFVDRWHESDSPVSLREFLGMDPVEYNLWLEDSTLLPHIILARRLKQPVHSVVRASQDLPLAARSSSSKSVAKLLAWLEEQGLLED